MAIRGFIGFRVDGQDKLTYNHYDSNPEYLGEAVAEVIRRTCITAERRARLREQVRAIQMLDENEAPSEKLRAKAEARGLCNLRVSTGRMDDLYCVLHGAHGRLDAYLCVGAMPDVGTFPLDSLFCEYGYIINLDDNCFELYRGFNTNRRAPGRYSAGLPANKTYGGVALVGSIPLEAIAESQSMFWGLYYPEDS